MFTGIIEELGKVITLESRGAGARLGVECSGLLQDATVGASIAINGTCVTAVELGEKHFAADLAPETLARTNLGQLRPGSMVNLERPLRANARLDGHFVLGHVDATAELLSLEALGNDSWWLRIQVPRGLERYIVEKGSLAVDGMSLTVAEIKGAEVGFTIIPHTYRNTTLQGYQPRAKINIEVDVLAKHLEKLTTR